VRSFNWRRRSRPFSTIARASFFEEALKSYRESLEIIKNLAEQHPRDLDLQSHLSLSHSKSGDVQSAQGDLSSALDSYRETLGIRENLAKQDPSNADWQGDLAWTYWRTGSTWAKAEPKSRRSALNNRSPSRVSLS
jgi:tetratricopeptide (TPR) repeat protein